MKLTNNSVECPHCGANLIHSEIPPESQHLFNGKYFLRVIAVYDIERDRTVAYRCPDCGAEDKR